MQWPLVISPKNGSPVTTSRVFCFAIILLMSRNLLNYIPTTLPPRLSPLLSHTTPIYPPLLNDWKRPLTISLHARLNGSFVRLSLFTSGVHTDTYGRSFSSVGCMIGTVVVSAIETRPELTVCLVPRSYLTYNAPLTVVLQYNQPLRDAMNETQQIKGENFTIYPQDVRVLPKEAAPYLNVPGSLAAVRTAVRWQNHMMDVPSKSRYQLCMMTAMRQYPFLLKDWMDYYRRMGVDYFYIYENSASTPLRDHIDTNYAEVVHWPWSRSQMQSNNHFLLAARNRCKFVAFFDADEYVMIGDRQRNALKRYVLSRRNEGWSQVVFHFLMMVNNGYVKRPKGSLPDLYTLREKGQRIRQGKAVIYTDCEWTWHRIHMVEGRGCKTYWNTTLELNPQSLQHNSMLVHYSKRSWEDFVAKNAVGGASVMTTGRPKKVLKVDEPDKMYMAIEGQKFVRFKKVWKRVMKRPDDGCIELERHNHNGDRHSWSYCPRCLMHQLHITRCESL
ncbi:unnamed protein product [Agarophyton chilense]|eukprot:gb/GEZJ01003521.1/.p1 GENE.gb/GEZJ01003521.1/~~gb/GEZJ01003521.1/.p1  ORF type:complete len:501 (-),score=20.27 gb/GEZJ01003521.1/:318-1820(-)